MMPSASMPPTRALGKVRDGSTVSNWAFAALSGASGSSFYRVDLLTGAASRTGDFAARNPRSAA